MVTNLSLLNATVLTSTRMPSTMAEDGYLPRRSPHGIRVMHAVDRHHCFLHSLRRC